MEQFKEEVRKFYRSYYEYGDAAHLIDHADSVCDLALHINKYCDERLVILASYMHDMFNATNRPKHDELAYAYVLKAEDEFLQELSEKELQEVAYAVLEHRASFKGEFYSSLSAVISSADRGLPDLEFIVIRSMKFNNGNAEDVYAHVSSKYGSKGYAKYPEIYQEIFKDELEAFQKEADVLSVQKVMEIWKKGK